LEINQLFKYTELDSSVTNYNVNLSHIFTPTTSAGPFWGGGNMENQVLCFHCEHLFVTHSILRSIRHCLRVPIRVMVINTGSLALNYSFLFMKGNR